MTSLRHPDSSSGKTNLGLKNEQIAYICPTKSEKMIRIPYGKSDYRTMVEENYFYQDRTPYIKTLEESDSTYLLYLRPRRFGKSLLLSVLRYYYGLQHQAAFESLFGDTFIGKNPTRLANKYMVLNFDFSGINTSTEQGVSNGFLSNVKYGISAFLSQYDAFFTKEQAKIILQNTEPNEMMKALLSCYTGNKIEPKIYVLIDEYDHFANELISFNFNHFMEIITKNGYVRKFYEVIKTATGHGQVGRILMTGVSPITVDSLTSGFNIAKNISLSATFHQMVGFDEQEVANILAGVEMPSEEIPAALNDMRLWYNGYLFNADVKKHVYNPNMVLYFADAYKTEKAYPDAMLDANIASDYSKIQKLFSIQGREDQYLDVLKMLLEKGDVTAALTTQYSFERGFTQNDLVSILFYMGFLTIKSKQVGAHTFSFPNYVIKKLYADYFFNSILEKAQLPIDNNPVNQAIREMAVSGDPKAFFEQVNLILKYFSTRDKAHFNENTLKAIIMSLLHQQNFYYIHSEYETNWTYMDVFLEAIHGQKPTYEFTMELKYAAKGGKTAIATLLQEATTQLQGYLSTPKFNTRTNIKSFVVVVVGYKLVWQPI
jgi:Predicted AAA-ATPase/PD-(D/E)XK nuclease superfamily